MAESITSNDALALQSKSVQSLQNVLPTKKHLSIKKGHAPFTYDDTLKYFYFIMDGKIKISQINFDTGRELTTHLLTRGDMFDVITLLDTKEHEYIATALENSQIVQVPIADVRALVEKDSGFNTLFFPYLAQQMRNYEDIAVDVTLYDIYERLLRLFARYAKQNESNNNIKPLDSLTHDELASLVGSVRKVVNRNLQKMKKEGLISTSRQHIELTNLDKLLEKLS